MNKNLETKGFQSGVIKNNGIAIDFAALNFSVSDRKEVKKTDASTWPVNNELADFIKEKNLNLDWESKDGSYVPKNRLLVYKIELEKNRVRNISLGELIKEAMDNPVTRNTSSPKINDTVTRITEIKTRFSMSPMKNVDSFFDEVKKSDLLGKNEKVKNTLVNAMKNFVEKRHNSEQRH